MLWQSTGRLLPLLAVFTMYMHPAKNLRYDRSVYHACDYTTSCSAFAFAVSGNGSTMERNTVSVTGCPSYVNWPINPNSATLSRNARLFVNVFSSRTAPDV